MGSTFVEYRGMGFEASDTTLEVLLAMLVDEIDAMPNPPAWLRALRDYWNEICTAQYGYGVMPGLDRYLTEDAQRDVIVALLARVLSRLEAFGAEAPAEFLNGLRDWGRESQFSMAVEGELLRRPVRFLIHLLQGNLGPGEIDARFAPE